MKSLVFYDGSCGLCDRIVQWLLTADKHQQFVFAPLQGEASEKFLETVPYKYKEKESLILIEDYKNDSLKIYVRAKAVLRILWLLGGFWRLIGWLFIFPSFLFDWIYIFVAKNRHRVFSNNQCILPESQHKDRFLP